MLYVHVGMMQHCSIGVQIALMFSIALMWPFVSVSAPYYITGIHECSSGELLSSAAFMHRVEKRELCGIILPLNG